jgi:hypothetical protein
LNYENSDKREGEKIVDIEDTKSDASNDQRNIEDIEDEEEYQNERQEFDFDFINKTVKAINERQVSDSDIQNLYLALGKYFYDAVSEDIKNISRMYKNYDALKGLQVNDFLLERPKSLVLLIITLVGVD